MVKKYSCYSQEVHAKGTAVFVVVTPEKNFTGRTTR